MLPHPRQRSAYADRCCRQQQLLLWRVLCFPWQRLLLHSKLQLVLATRSHKRVGTVGLAVQDMSTSYQYRVSASMC
jgi:hypothetical protein